jgi:hypothetical protein
MSHKQAVNKSLSGGNTVGRYCKNNRMTGGYSLEDFPLGISRIIRSNTIGRSCIDVLNPEGRSLKKMSCEIQNHVRILSCENLDCVLLVSTIRHFYKTMVFT